MNSGDARMGVMPAMFDCSTAELDRKDHVLNQTYGAARRSLSVDKQKQLQDLERKWIALRDRKCHAEAEKVGSDSQDGTLVWYGCLLKETNDRIQWLKAFPR